MEDERGDAVEVNRFQNLERVGILVKEEDHQKEFGTVRETTTFTAMYGVTKRG